MKKKILWIAITLIVVVLGGVFTAKMISIKKPSELPEFFKEKKTPEKEIEKTPYKIAPKVSKELPPLNLRLIGVIIGKPSLAFIRDLETQQKSFYRENEIVKGAKIIKIEKKRIVLLREGKREILPLMGDLEKSEKETIVTISPTERIISKAGVNREIEDINELIKGINILPSIEEGKIKGWQVENTNEENIATKAGIESKDVITAINDNSLSSLRDIAKIYKDIKDKREIKIDLLRDNEKVRLNYKIRD